jgi:hypothetical protein
MAAGMGGVYMVVATFATLIVFATLSVLRQFEPILGKGAIYSVSLELASDVPGLVGMVIESLTNMDIVVESIGSSRPVPGKLSMSATIVLPRGVTIDQVSRELCKIDGLERFELV